MKKYIIRYRPSIGSFLDIHKIEWTSNDTQYQNWDDTITIQLTDDEEFATLIIDYVKWLDTI